MLLAHLTDLHLPIPEKPRLRDLMGKRALGYLSWARNRRRRHVLSALQRIADDRRVRAPDFTVLSGDIVNISLESEFSAAIQWLERNFDPAETAVAPGNHDAYVKLSWSAGAGRFQAFMKGTRLAEEIQRPPADERDFPFVRTVDGIALIFVNSSPPTLPGLASGRLGEGQRDRLRAELLRLKARGHCRILVIHHPITEGAVSRRKGLDDAAPLRAILAETGVELVLHGHTHFPLWETIETLEGPRPVVGGGSASHPDARGRYRPARYNLFSIEERGAGAWRITAAVRELDPKTGAVETVEKRELLST